MSIDHVLKNELTAQQYNAAVDTSREVLCLACAGSGKSRTLAYRIARLLSEGEPPEGIVAFTFTEKSAESIKRRVSQSLTAAGLDATVMGAMYIGTIHSYCQHVLGDIDAKYRQYDVLDENRLKLYMISRYYQLGLPGFRPRARSNSYFDAIKQTSEAWKTANDELLAAASSPLSPSNTMSLVKGPVRAIDDDTPLGSICVSVIARVFGVAKTSVERLRTRPLVIVAPAATDDVGMIIVDETVEGFTGDAAAAIGVLVEAFAMPASWSDQLPDFPCWLPRWRSTACKSRPPGCRRGPAARCCCRTAGDRDHRPAREGERDHQAFGVGKLRFARSSTNPGIVALLGTAEAGIVSVDVTRLFAGTATVAGCTARFGLVENAGSWRAPPTSCRASPCRSPSSRSSGCRSRPPRCR